MVAPDSAISVRRQCDLLGLHRSGFYYTPAPVSQQDLILKSEIDRIFTARPEYGVRRIELALRANGHSVGKERIRRLMRDMGIEPIYPKPRMSVPADNFRRFPYLLRDIEITRPHQVWAADLTYIPLRRGWIFLVAVMDWFSRAVLSWDLSVTRDSKFSASVYQEALRVAGRQPEIMNTDQGSEFTAEEWVGLVLASGALVSQDGRGRALDNRMIERLWRTVKYECLYPQAVETPQDVHKHLSAFFPYYNHERWHQGLDNRTPWSVLLGTNQNEAGGTPVAFCSRPHSVSFS